MIRSIVRGFGSALPKRVVTNREMEIHVDTTDEWIVQRTGIRQRYLAGEGETPPPSARPRRGLRSTNAGLTPDDIDLIIVATSTPDNTFPATAVNIQNRLGMKHGAAFDMQAVCTGFVYAVTTADAYIRGGLAKRALVIGAETFSRILDWNDRTHLRALRRRRRRDRAGSRRRRGDQRRSRRADRASALRRLAQGQALCRRRPVFDRHGWPPSDGRPRSLQACVGMITDVIVDAFEAVKLPIDAIDWLVPHQANIRIIEARPRSWAFPWTKWL